MPMTISDLGLNLTGEAVNRTSLKVMLRVLGSLEARVFDVISQETENYELRLFKLNMKDQDAVDKFLKDLEGTINELLSFMVDNYDETMGGCIGLLLKRDELLKQWGDKLPDDLYDNLLSLHVPSKGNLKIRSIVDLYALHDFLSTDVGVILAGISAGFMDAYVTPPPVEPKGKKATPKAKKSQKVVQLFKK
jgi:hypothetical protein